MNYKIKKKNHPGFQETMTWYYAKPGFKTWECYKEYEDVFLDDVPISLPLIRWIKHQINLMTRVTILVN
jgi:hypothetical protein